MRFLAPFLLLVSIANFVIAICHKNGITTLSRKGEKVQEMSINFNEGKLEYRCWLILPGQAIIQLYK